MLIKGNEKDCVIGAFTCSTGNVFFKNSQEILHRMNLTNKVRLLTVFKSFFSRQYVPYMSTKAIIYAFLDG